jgi:glycosyltransferase involved in cell wall biosynthesis
MSASPLVSICCATYNHETFIQDAVEGFLMQDIEFPYEILINDDASTDNTPDILREYERLFPELVNVVYQKENQYSKGGVSILLDFLVPRAKGRYVALCEGDDYWIDRHKLEKQVSYMENNLTCSVASGDFYIRYEDDICESGIVLSKSLEDKDWNGGRFDMSYVDSAVIPRRVTALASTLTAVYRTSFLRAIDRDRYDHFRDSTLVSLALSKGHGFRFDDAFAVYRKHAGGLTTNYKSISWYRDNYMVYKEIYDNDPNKYNRRLYVSAASAYVFALGQSGKGAAGEKSDDPFPLAKEMIGIASSIRDFSAISAVLLREIKHLATGKGVVLSQ